MTSVQDSNFWLFGYGSLIWKPPPHWEERIPGYITGYVRRFWQASEDHRGTPKAPGRVVTLIERVHWETLNDTHAAATDDRVWGVAYRITPSNVDEVKEYLDIREVGGYSIHYEPFHPDGAAAFSDTTTTPFKCLVYIGLPNNPQFLGVQDPQDVAQVISVSVGPSGENKEYLFQLERSLDGLGEGSSRDDHVHDLSRRVRALLMQGAAAGRQAESPRLALTANGYMDGHGLTKVGSTDEQEEIEKES